MIKKARTGFFRALDKRFPFKAEAPPKRRVLREGPPARRIDWISLKNFSLNGM